jgi:peptide/nickel transport system substrate-binding protein
MTFYDDAPRTERSRPSLLGGLIERCTRRLGRSDERALPGSDRPTSHRRGRLRLTGGLAVALTVVGAATATATSAQITRKPVLNTKKPVLTVGIPSAPTSLNPALDSLGWQSLVHELSYATLTHLRPNESAAPELATSWRYVGTGNRKFEFTLRHDARFADGTPVTAQAVKQWFEYLNAGGTADTLPKLSSVTTVGRWTVVLHLTTPNPSVPYLLSDFDDAAMIASPKALAHPSMLSSATYGAGEYTLVPSETVQASHYTFVPNKFYYQPSAIKYSKVVVDIIPTTASLLSALKAGQLDVAVGDTTTAASAASAGFKVDYASGAWDGIILQNHGGSPTTNPLASQRVRQALNYAINRRAITKALMGKYSLPTSEAITFDGGDKNRNLYPYDPTKAKAMLAAAGYPHGFTLTAVDENYNGNLGNPMVQAVAQNLAAIGVTLNITSESTPGAWVQAGLEGSKLPDAFQITYNGTVPMSLFYTSGFASNGAILNPFKLDDPVLDNLYAKASVARNPTPDWEAMSRRISDEAYIVPVFETPIIVYARKSVGGIYVSGSSTLPFITEWHPT